MRRVSRACPATVLLFVHGLGAAEPGAAFLQHLEALGVKVDPGDSLAHRVLLGNGAHFLARDGVVAPRVWIFQEEAEVAAFQASMPVGEGRAAGVRVVLQRPAFQALQAALREAREAGIPLTPDGELATRRTLADTRALWRSRLGPGLDHWIGRGRLTQAEARVLLGLPDRAQVEAALRLEAKGLLLSTQWNKSILASVAAPGTSQHLALVALDVVEHEDPRVRALLARHGWFQTVYGDLHHFTYLGVKEADLPALGLVPRKRGIRVFWGVPRRP